MEAPKWHIFERIEELEKLRPTVDDISKLAVITFMLFFRWLVMEKPSRARRLKDDLIAILAKNGLSTETLKSLQQFMLGVCERAEK